MNARTFLQEFEQSVERDALVDAVYQQMLRFAKEEDIPSNEVSDQLLLKLAEGFVERGLGVPVSKETLAAKEKYRSESFEDEIQMLYEMQEVDTELIKELKRLSNENEDYSWTEEL